MRHVETEQRDALRAENVRLREALEQIAERVDELEHATQKPVPFVEVRALQEQARAALAEVKP